MPYTGFPIKPIKNPTAYIEHCSGFGSIQCQRIRKTVDLSNVSPALWNSNPGYGSSNYVEINGERVGFRCCVICSRPLDRGYALRLNDAIGFEPPTAKDLTARLKAMKERLSRNDGQSR